MIELKNVSRTYRLGTTEVRALNNVSLSIKSGEFVAIMGPSGSGKSSLLHILGCLDRPDQGSYSLLGREISKLSDDELALVRNTLAGFVFQQFHLLARLTARDNVALPLVYAGKKDQGEVGKRLGEVGLSERTEHRPGELSGGEQQRVAIARSLINDPIVIFADEPTGNLDTKSESEIIGIIKQLHEQGKTIVMVTHEPDIGSQAERVIRMRDGQIISDETNKQHENGTARTVPKEFHWTGVRTGAVFFDYFRQATMAIFGHKMRAFLSMLGIFIGVAAVIAMLAVGQGAKESIRQSISSMGSNLLILRPGARQVGGVMMQAGSVTRFTIQDCAALRKSDTVNGVSGSVFGRAQLVAAGKNWNTQLNGVDVDYARMRAMVPVIGRFFLPAEMRSRSKVAVIGMTVVKQLFDGKNPIGETIKINRVNFTVIGVLPEKGASFGQDQDDVVLVPLTTAMYRLLGKEYVDSIFVEARDEKVVDDTKDEITQLIMKQHHLSDSNSFQIMNMSEIQQALETTTRTITWLLGSIATISLIVGGIGIMNIMLVSVTERTREIGLRKAIGARGKDIMSQFLIEAVVLTLTGGLLGIAFGSGFATLLSAMAGWAVRVSLFSVLLASGFSVVVGVGFGLWPARQAASLDPITALRYE